MEVLTSLGAALLGAIVGGGVSLATALLSLKRTRRDNTALAIEQHQRNADLAVEQHRRARRTIMARVSVREDLATGPLLLVHNNTGESINGLQIDVTLMRAETIEDAGIEGHTRIDVLNVPPAGEALSLRLPSDWLLAQGDDAEGRFCIIEVKFRDALGDFWQLEPDGTVSLEQTAEDFDAELLSMVESDAFETDDVDGRGDG